MRTASSPISFRRRTSAKNSLARSIARANAGDRVLLYRAQGGARRAAGDAARTPDSQVTIVPAYMTVTPPDAAFAEKVARADVLTFTSASTVRGFVTLLDGSRAGGGG